jgi:lysophospholipase L1-like esterase
VERVSGQGTGSNESRPIVILGASYAASWKLPNLDGIPVVNAGVPGQQSFEMLARFESDVVAVGPRAVVLWGFINDVFRADDTTQSLARVRESYAEMTKRARAQRIEPIIATEVTIRPPKAFVETVMSMVGPLLGKQSYQDRVNGHVMEANQWLRELAHREGLLVLDLQGALADTDGRRRREFATDDGSHISPEGYEALTDYARPILSNRLRSSTWSSTVQR